MIFTWKCPKCGTMNNSEVHKMKCEKCGHELVSGLTTEKPVDK